MYLFVSVRIQAKGYKKEESYGHNKCKRDKNNSEKEEEQKGKTNRERTTFFESFFF